MSGLEAKLQGMLASACQRSVRVSATDQKPSSPRRSARISGIRPFLPGDTSRQIPGYMLPRETIQQREERLEALKAEREAQELAECTFRPAINPESVYYAGERSGPAYERLYNHALDKQEREQDLFEMGDVLDETVYTFKPQLKAKYVPKSDSSKVVIRMADVPSEMKQCVFKPKLSPTSERICKRKFGDTPVFERLTRPPERPVSASDKCSSSANTSINGCTSPDTVEKMGTRGASGGPKRRSTVESFNEFLSRQEYIVAKKQLTASRVNREELRECTFKPKISETSKLIAQTIGARDPLYERTYSADTRGSSPRRTAGIYPSLDDQDTFVPHINERSKRIMSAKCDVPVYDRLYQDSETQHRLELLKKQQDQLSANGCTFQPAKIANQPEHIGSTIKNLDEYMEERRQMRLRMDQERQARADQREDLEECTFKPKIIKAPSSIRKIVSELRKNDIHARL
ncbi:Hypothetical protein GLP15_1076 [Giardia lamblia P15]|uniref:Uncharacterized protein n=1 Tax=Giardia intestinalis (strain P15) TaxID=658858 RepID=E1F2M2_GIAIA|nr:Hypothetical protein GLP15_1076 [Giardia lamblia P15]